MFSVEGVGKPGVHIGDDTRFPGAADVEVEVLVGAEPDDLDDSIPF